MGQIGTLCSTKPWGIHRQSPSRAREAPRVLSHRADHLRPARSGSRYFSFPLYRQYASVDDVLVQLFEHVITEMTVASDGWISGTNIHLEPQLRGLHQVYLNHGPLLRAVADAEVGELKATSEAYTSMMAMWDEAVTVRITESYPWVKQPALVAHALNAADERLMYYDYGKGPDSISEELFEDTFQVMYRMWCSALGIQPGSEQRVI